MGGSEMLNYYLRSLRREIANASICFASFLFFSALYTIMILYVYVTQTVNTLILWTSGLLFCFLVAPMLAKLNFLRWIETAIFYEERRTKYGIRSFLTRGFMICAFAGFVLFAVGFIGLSALSTLDSLFIENNSNLIPLLQKGYLVIAVFFYVLFLLFAILTRSTNLMKNLFPDWYQAYKSHGTV